MDKEGLAKGLRVRRAGIGGGGRQAIGEVVYKVKKAIRAGIDDQQELALLLQREPALQQELAVSLYVRQSATKLVRRQ